MAVRDIREYEPVVGRDEVEDILCMAERVKGTQVIHVNATAYGGGVAEILKSLVPLTKSVGVKAEWLVIRGSKDFFDVTKSIHNALQGDASIEIGRDLQEIYLKVNEMNSEMLRSDSLDSDGVVVIHDPQPLPLVEFREGGRWVWRCHIDTSQPNMKVWSFLKKYVEKYDALIFSREAYIPPDIRGAKIFIRYPSIDPLSDKNRGLGQSEIGCS